MNKEDIGVAELLEYLGYEDVIIFNDYGVDALIGVDSNNRAVYDYEKMAVWLMKNWECTYEEAVDWIEYNTIRSLPYVGDDAPIVVRPVGHFIY